MRILAIDPGPDQSAYAILDGRRLIRHKKDINTLVALELLMPDVDEIVIEMIASYGMPVGREVFETCIWIGRYAQIAHRPCYRLYRQDIKLHLCRSAKANDASIRQSLIDRFGPGREKAVGTKKAPGPLYGVSNDAWSALAIAITWTDTRDLRKKEPV